VGPEAAKVDVDPKGGMKLDPGFFLPVEDGYSTRQVRLEGGDSSSDTFCYP
jgi:selenium-binding protein 1